MKYVLVYSRNDKFFVFCSVALHYRIQRTFSHDCISTRIVGTDTRMSKVILESGKTQTLGCFFEIFVDPLVKKLETNMSKSILRLDICMSKLPIYYNII